MLQSASAFTAFSCQNAGPCFTPHGPSCRAVKWWHQLSNGQNPNNRFTWKGQRTKQSNAVLLHNSVADEQRMAKQLRTATLGILRVCRYEYHGRRSEGISGSQWWGAPTHSVQSCLYCTVWFHFRPFLQFPKINVSFGLFLPVLYCWRFSSCSHPFFFHLFFCWFRKRNNVGWRIGLSLISAVSYIFQLLEESLSCLDFWPRINVNKKCEIRTSQTSSFLRLPHHAAPQRREARERTFI